MQLSLCVLLAVLLTVVRASNNTLGNPVAPSNPRKQCIGSPYDALIQKQLRPFHQISQAHLNAAEAFSFDGYRVIIINNELFASPIGNLDTEAARLDLRDARKLHASLLVLVKLLCAFRVPDVEFIFSLAETHSLPRSVHLPVFKWVKHVHDSHLVFPYWSLLWSRGLFKAPVTAWSDKKPVAIWRGSTTGGIYTATNWQGFARSQLCLLCRNHTDICDAGFNMVSQGSPQAQKAMQDAGVFRPAVSNGDWTRYKYVIVVDGNVSPSSRMFHVLKSGSLMLKQDSSWTEYYYPMFLPYVHYVPVANNMSDILLKIRWAQENDDLAARIAENARNTADLLLNDAAVACYMYQVLRNYAAHQAFSPAVRPGFTKIRPLPGVMDALTYRCLKFNNT